MTKMKWIVTAILFMTFLSCSTNTLWPDGKINYTLINLDQTDTEILLKAMLKWETATGGAVKFELTEQCGDGILHIMKEDLSDSIGGMATVGYSDTDFLRLVLNSNYQNEYIDKHELGHVIGFSDDYVNQYSIMYFMGTVDEEKDISFMDAEKVIELYDRTDGNGKN